MEELMLLSRLESYARRCLGAESYPRDQHVFKPVSCPTCGVVPLQLLVEHHTGSRADNFRGIVRATCPTCGTQTLVLHFTGPHREPERNDRPVCPYCRRDRWLLAELERYEADLAGFFDEGVLVGCCAECGHLQDLLYTD